jgi:hypothetical protein
MKIILEDKVIVPPLMIMVIAVAVFFKLWIEL